MKAQIHDCSNGEDYYIDISDDMKRFWEWLVNNNVHPTESTLEFDDDITYEKI